MGIYINVLTGVTIATTIKVYLQTIRSVHIHHITRVLIFIGMYSIVGSLNLFCSFKTDQLKQAQRVKIKTLNSQSV